MTGAWTGKPQRRYASSSQFGSGKGPFIDTVDWRWEGAFEGPSSMVGLAILSTDECWYWVKSQPPVPRPEVGVSAHGWTTRPSTVSVAGSFHGVGSPSVPVELTDAPPSAFVMGPSIAMTGSPHVVARVARVTFAVVLLPASVVRVGRNRLWRLREPFAGKLAPGLRELLTRGRSGKA